MKRHSDRQMTKDDGSDNDSDKDLDSAQAQPGSFEKASDEVLSTRRIIKVKRSSAPSPIDEQATPSKSKPSTNVFANFSFAPPQQKQVIQEKQESPEEKKEILLNLKDSQDTEKLQESKEAKEDLQDEPKNNNTVFSQPVEDKEPKINIEGGLSTSPPNHPVFNFGTTTSLKPFNFGTSIFGSGSTSSFSALNKNASTAPGFNFGFSNAVKKDATENNEEKSDEDDTGAEEPECILKNEKTEPILPEQKVSTGEEDEECFFKGKSKLFILEENNWKERGIGTLKLNVKIENAEKKAENKETEDKEKDSKILRQARILMRTDGSFRLALNFALLPEFTFDRAADKMVRFVAYDADLKKISSFLVKMPSKEDIDSIVSALEKWKSTCIA